MKAIIAELVNHQPTGRQFIVDLATRTETLALVVEQLLNDLQDQNEVSLRRYFNNSSVLEWVGPMHRRRLEQH
ncbi:hypothetical protein [Kitasatospora sp. NPDC059599]|uniref:hypothetical protein n=1 Tax=Kitasatospora sp. NPDC059599 TaxID=3346880 RepID=UPI00368B1CAA